MNLRYTPGVDLLLGTNNKGKVIEIGEVLAGLPVTLLTPSDCAIVENPEETGTTFAENAEQKARFYFRRTGIPTLADDSGIEVEALQRELGLHTRRWGAGPDASDEEWIQFFLQRMQREQNKRARFVCTLAHIDANGQLHLFDGACHGTITPTLEAPYLPGLPISGCFRPDGHDRVFSALTIEQKNRVSHRGRAAQALRTFLSSSAT